MRRLGLIGLMLVAGACHEATRSSRQLVVLAVDGLDPEMLSRLMAEGRVPQLSSLAQTSGIVRVTSTPGAESASAWASFATGTNPGGHGMFDVVAPDPVSGRPVAATLRPRSSARWIGPLWREGAAYAPVRTGAPFWTRLGEAGIRSRVLFVPGTFPPEPVPGGSIVAGTPLPDWSGAWGSGYTWLASDVAAEDVGFTRYGGRRERLTFTRNVAHATLIGIRAPERIDVPLTVAWNPEDRSANITIADETVHLTEGQRSRWITIAVRLNLVKRVQGLVHLQLVKAGNDVQVYVSPIQWHPISPPSAIASPPGASTALFGRIGPFRTLAWPEAAWGFADGWLSRDALETALVETFDDRAAALLSQAESSGWDLLIGGIETLAITARLVGRRADGGGSAGVGGGGPAADTLTQAYLRLDALVGELRARLPAGAAMVVVSPHGLKPTSRVVDLNRWLSGRGWLAWRTSPEPVTLAALAEPSAWADTVDWPRTLVRATGAGHLYVNVSGRGPEGGVEQGAPYDALVATLREALEGLTDPLSGRHVVARARTAREAYAGARVSEAPDLVVTWAPGYTGSWESMLGGMAAEVVAPNLERWLAAHAGHDESHVPGVWVSSIPLSTDALSVLDVAPTVLEYFGQTTPADIEGRAQLRDKPSSTSRK